MQNLKTMPLAVLIDCQNISSSFASTLFAHVECLGRPIVKRVYGDGRDDFSGWKKTCEVFGIQAIQQAASVASKNAADMSLIIDGMDLLHTGRFGGFCLVSSDGDFTALATRIRAEGAVVHGFGERKRPLGFASACDSFTILESPDVVLVEETNISLLPKLTSEADEPSIKAAARSELILAFQRTSGPGRWANPSIIAQALGGYREQLGPGKFLKVLERTGLVDIKWGSKTLAYVRLKTPNSSAGEASR